MISFEIHTSALAPGDAFGRQDAALDGGHTGCRHEDRLHPRNSIYPDRNRSEWIVAQRPPRPGGDPFTPHGCFLEDERAADGRIIRSGTILLTNRECPWRCLMCDLWQHALPHAVPLGAIPRQIDAALARLATRPEQIKLYNSGSFFDPGAISPADHPAIAQRLAFSRHLIVESHPRLVDDKVLAFRDRLAGSLEVALGLETVHPGILSRLNKRLTLRQFARAAQFLRRENLAVRAFVLVKTPWMTDAEAVMWAVKSARFAFDCGASVVSLIPTRPGNGALDRLMAAGEFAPPSLAALEQAQAGVLRLRVGRVFADTWDLEQFSTCAACFGPRRRRLQFVNLQQHLLPPCACAVCGGQEAQTAAPPPVALASNR